jgi:hypothetical protein
MIQSGRRKNSNEEEVVKMTNEKMVNGVNVEQLFSTINQVKENPKIAQFKFRAKNTWVDGTRNQATIKDFYGCKFPARLFCIGVNFLLISSHHFFYIFPGNDLNQKSFVPT